MVRHVVWDWNGTLIDDQEVVVAAANDALTAAGREPIDADYYRTHYVRPVHLFYEHALGRPIPVDEWLELDDLYHDSYARRLDRAQLKPDALDALRHVADSGRSQSLLSMWRHDALMQQVERFGLASWFTRIDGLRGAGGGLKAQHMEEHLSALGLTGEDVLVIGDAIDDADAARHCGAACVLYDGGSHHRAELEAAGVPVVDSLAAAVDAVAAS